ncbi:MAG: hypothetical protein IT326_08310, partial [Anaerolineae bacterium]|nr:hypothetical protein [Anaerolineae bacterium]
PRTTADIEKLVASVIDENVALGQLDRSGLTLGDLKQIKETFVHTLKGMYHPRIVYPGQTPPPDDDEEPRATAQEPAEHERRSV